MIITVINAKNIRWGRLLGMIFLLLITLLENKKTHTDTGMQMTITISNTKIAYRDQIYVRKHYMCRSIKFISFFAEDILPMQMIKRQDYFGSKKTSNRSAMLCSRMVRPYVRGI